MTLTTTGWSLAHFATAYRNGLAIVDVIDAVLRDLDNAPAGVLIGEPLHQAARQEAMRLTALDAAALPLYGVPFIVKDNIDVAGAPTTAACPGFRRIAGTDATVVRLLRSAGAIPVGKANLDQFATGLVGTRSPYGTPPNALDPMLVPGGSSSGSAVGVALGLVPFSLGTDTAGSGRVPAALNGVVGLKPTFGSMSTSGIVPAVRRLDCPSVFATSVGDAALVARIMRGADPLDPFTRKPPPRRPFRTTPVIGIPRAWHPSIEIHPDIDRWFNEGIDALRDLGLETRTVDIGPLIDMGSMLYGSTALAERTAAVGELVAKEIEGIDPIVARIIGAGADLTAVEAYLTEHELVRLRAAAASIWDDVDALVLPTTAILPTLEQVAADPFGPNEMLGHFTTFANLLDLACLVVPIRSGGAAVPAGMQLVAPAWRDDELVRIASGLAHGSIAPAEQPCSIVVVGAHLTGQPLNHQLRDRRASLIERTTTSAEYRLYALADSIPPKPGLVWVGADTGAAIDVEVWSMAADEFGTFVQAVPPPLCIGTVATAGGRTHKGFLCEARGLIGALDITEHRGWRRYLSTSM